MEGLALTMGSICFIDGRAVAVVAKGARKPILPPKEIPNPLRSRLRHSPRCSSPLLTGADGRPHRHGRDTMRTRERRMHTATRRGSPGANVVPAAAAPLLGNAEAATITAIAGGPGRGAGALVRPEVGARGRTVGEDEAHVPFGPPRTPSVVLACRFPCIPPRVLRVARGFSDSLHRAGRVRDVPESGGGVRESSPRQSAVFRHECAES